MQAAKCRNDRPNAGGAPYKLRLCGMELSGHGVLSPCVGSSKMASSLIYQRLKIEDSMRKKREDVRVLIAEDAEQVEPGIQIFRRDGHREISVVVMKRVISDETQASCSIGHA